MQSSKLPYLVSPSQDWTFWSLESFIHVWWQEPALKTEKCTWSESITVNIISRTKTSTILGKMLRWITFKIAICFIFLMSFFVFSATSVLIETYWWGCLHGVMDCGIVVREFILQSRYYIHFRANTLGKSMNPPYPPSYGLNSTTTVLLGE